jgi:hypothetical protein
MITKEKAAGPWRGEAASNTHYALHGIDPIPPRQPRRQPAYAKQLLEAKRRGFTVAWLCIAVDDWSIGRACPRIIVTSGIQPAELDLRIVRGLQVLVAHRGQHERALRVASLALAHGAVCAPILDLESRRVTSSAEIVATMGVNV